MPEARSDLGYGTSVSACGLDAGPITDGMNRRSESIPESSGSQTYGAYHDVHLSAAIWAAQRLHVSRRSKRDRAALQRLHLAGTGDSRVLSSASVEGRKKR